MTHPAMDEQDALRVREAFRLAGDLCGTAWPDWSADPFPVLLVTADHEYLVGTRDIPEGFIGAGHDSILGVEVATRPRQFDRRLAAAFPAFEVEPVVVIGQPEVLDKNSTQWVLTVLHEHFHQLQMSDPAYPSAVESLDLSGGDQTGMWMLNYPFPYESQDVVAAFDMCSRELAGALRSSDGDHSDFWAAYGRFLDGLSGPDRRYLEFQLWQEGVARYVELRLGEMAATASQPSREFQELPDFEPFGDVAARMREAVVAALDRPNLREWGRESFYPFGAALALVLDRDHPEWKTRYLTERFALVPL